MAIQVIQGHLFRFGWKAIGGLHNSELRHNNFGLIYELWKDIAAARSNNKAVLSQRWPRNAPYGTPWLRQRLLCQNFSWAFVPIDPMNVRTKFEVRTFTNSWHNRGYHKNVGSPWICPPRLFSKILKGFSSDASYMNVPAKFKVCSFTRSRVNRG